MFVYYRRVLRLETSHKAAHHHINETRHKAAHHPIKLRITGLLACSLLHEPARSVPGSDEWVRRSFIMAARTSARLSGVAVGAAFSKKL
mgnify:CR=1 FL=1